MTVESIANGCLRIWLTDEELEQWGLCAPQPPLRQVRRLVRRAAAAAGWSDTGRVTAELIPVHEGGVLLVSPLPQPVDTPTVYHLQDGETLLELMRQWGYIQEVTPLCSLYEREEGYDLVFYDTAPLSLRQQYLLSEYGILMGTGEGMAARCGEYGEPLRVGWSLIARVQPQPVPQDPVH